MANMQGGETRRSERENAQRHGFNSESERRSRRVAVTNNGQNNGENTQGRGARQRQHQHPTAGGNLKQETTQTRGGIAVI